MIVYLNGAYIDHGEARVSVDDRGFLFADGAYEVIRVIDGRMFLPGPHWDRLRAGLDQLHIDASAAAGLHEVAERLLRENDLESADATVYVQVTRGAAPRSHAFPAGIRPTVYVAARPFRQHPASFWSEGVAAITVPDMRWSRCDIKSVSLLPNVLANQQAHAAGAFEALFVRDGVVIEGSHSNLFAVMDGELITYPSCNYILSGITRGLVFELAAELDIRARERPILRERLFDAEELFLSGTTTEIMPVVRVDGRAIGSGGPGGVARRLQAAYRERVAGPVTASAPR